ncbi:hypothetical protein FIE12Z_2026 [Fusarium flagelliforme]|uniref:Uncharacterized protein n=1 Tax=Fusarium flagelliforme TaxID=2675880 RepID=A0A395N155_9HYPO|nr:hypothetical protein FIE12Z_2026 [Fusarium flagelliforme]
MVNITADYLQEYKLSSQADTSLVQEYTIFLANTHFSSRQPGGASALGCRTAESFIRNEPDIPQDGIVDAAKAYHRIKRDAGTEEKETGPRKGSLPEEAKIAHGGAEEEEK